MHYLSAYKIKVGLGDVVMVGNVQNMSLVYLTHMLPNTD